MKNNRPKIAHFIRGFLRPTETFIGNQIATLQRYEPVVFCHHLIHGHSYPSIKATALTEMLSFTQRALQKSFYKIFRALTPFAANQLAESVRHSDAKILHFHYLVEARFFLPVLRRLQLPSIVSCYGWDVSLFPRTKFGYGYYYLQPVFREMDLFLAMSEDMKRDMMKIGCPEEKIMVHYFGNEVKRFAFPERQYEPKKELRILFCARLAGKKAPHLLLQALKKMEDAQHDNPKWKLVFVGEGPMRRQLESSVAEFGWKDKVEFTGHMPYHDVQFVEEYKKADIYVLPSMTVNGEKEGIPGTLIEAMASGLPCISTYHAGIPSVIDNEMQGKLVPEGDVEALAQSIKELMSSHELRGRLGRSAATRALNTLDLKEKTRELEGIYDMLLESKKKRP
jgi:colanic acid/amylovoran biosynthesis glycosyltransferase